MMTPAPRALPAPASRTARTAASLCSGASPARTSSIPTAAATRRAVAVLSPAGRRHISQGARVQTAALKLQHPVPCKGLRQPRLWSVFCHCSSDMWVAPSWCLPCNLDIRQTPPFFLRIHAITPEASPLFRERVSPHAPVSMSTRMRSLLECRPRQVPPRSAATAAAALGRSSSSKVNSLRQSPRTPPRCCNHHVRRVQLPRCAAGPCPVLHGARSQLW